jgi:hypothetical protein
MQRRPIALLIALAATLAAVGPAAAWSNGPSSGGVVGNGYGTHDWIIDQAVKVFGGKPPSWFEASTARLASDDPDTLFWKTNEHVYMEKGYGRGAVHQVVEYYNKAIYHLKNGDPHQASIDIGRLAHFYADLLQPFHTAYAASGKDSAHSKYELLVDSVTHHPGDMTAWMTADRSPGPVSSIRTLAIAAAAYSRAYFSGSTGLYAQFSKNTAVLNTRVKQITGYLLKKASRELADIIYSIGRKIGNAPAIGSIKAWPKHKTISDPGWLQAIYVEVFDTSGRRVEGARVNVTFPSSADITSPTPDSASTTAVYTCGSSSTCATLPAGVGPLGVAKATAWIDFSHPGVAQKATVKVTSRGKTLTTTVTYTPD